MKVVALLGSSASQTVEVDMTVDEHAFHTVFSWKLATAIGLKTFTHGPMKFDGPDVTMTVAYIRLQDREGAIPVVVRDESSPVLGWSALQCLGLRLSDDSQALEIDRPYGPAMLGVRNG
jgi:hypothetical protein